MPSGRYNNRLIPLLAFVLFSAVAVLLWRQQNDHERELVLRHVQTSVEQVRIRVEGLMSARLASLELIADRLVEKQPPDFSRSRFEGFAAALVKNYAGYFAIFWLDPDGVVRWVYPEDASAPATDGRPAGIRPPGDLLRPGPGTDEADIITSPCIRSPQGAAYLYALRALVHHHELQGYLAGLFSVDQIMALCLSKEVLNDFHIRVMENDRAIYQRDYEGRGRTSKADRNDSAALKASRLIRFAGTTWTIDIAPDPGVYPSGNRKNAAFLSFGLILSGALALLLHLLMKRMAMVKASRDQAVLEVAERKQAQAALRTNEKKLQTLLAELTAKNAELESFVYTVSHDLKTPIVTIEGFIGAFREDFGDRLTPAGDQYLGHMSDAAHKMERLINELLNYSRIGRIEEKRTAFSMDVPVKDAMETLKALIDAGGIAVNVQKGLPTVVADRKRIEQVVYNLLSNAVKYIGAGNPGPRIDIGCTPENGEPVFWVRDNGIGIDPQYFEKIFQIFERLPAAKRAGEGTGIGLAIVKRIIEHHGGSIWVTSAPDEGTTFFFTLKGETAE